MLALISILFSIIGTEPPERYKPGDRAAINVDINGDRVGEVLEIASREMEPDMEAIGLFDFHILLKNPRGKVLYESDEIGELGWFSLEKDLFEFEDGTKREIALVRTGCSGTGVHVNAIFLFQPPDTDTVAVIYEGSEGLYDHDSDGSGDMLVSRYRHDNLGIWGATSPWPPTFTMPSLNEGWQSVDKTFEVLHSDSGYRNEWIEELEQTYEALSDPELSDVNKDHLKYLKMLIDALDDNDTGEAARIYYTSF